MNELPEDILKLILSIVIGGLIGAEREFHDKTAGFRTIIFICVGATLFTIFSKKLGSPGAPFRIAANIVSGVGFLGAGVILRAKGRVVGLTTASMIWLAAAIGMGIGGGQYLFSCVTTGVVLIVLWFFPKLEEWIDNIRDTRTYEVTCNIGAKSSKQIDDIFRNSNVHVKKHKQCKNENNEMICTLITYGSPKNHDQVVEKLFTDKDVKSYSF